MLFVLALLACKDRQGGDDVDDTADTGTVDTGLEDEALITEGPALGDCTPQTGSEGVALSGVLLLESGPEFGVVLSQDGEITCVGDCDVSQATVVCTEGIIGAGVIDSHDHMQYNSLPPWRIGPEFSDRYDWRSDGRYFEYKSAYNDIIGDYGCQIMRWAETRAIGGGSTSAVGVYYDSCISGGLRNLDESDWAHGLDYAMDYSSRTVTSSVDAGDAEEYREELADGSRDVILDHVAEGWNSSVGSELDYMHEIGMTGPGFVVVHGSNATTAQLARLASEGTGVIWSPRSNLSLYGGTTPAHVARTLGVSIALGPDWSPSGSHTPRDELLCADDWLSSTGTPISDRAIWAMGTSDAARVLGLDGVLGTLETGAKADVVVFPYSQTPYRAAIDATAEEVLLVQVNGEAVFGDPALIAQLSPQSTCEAIEVCGEMREYCVSWSVESTESSLLGALAKTQVDDQSLEYTRELLGLFQCEGESRGACTPLETSPQDPDADGIAQDVDLCIDVWNPLQGDHDGDGIGDACDVCPLMPDATDCEHDPVDIDDDGVLYDADICPVNWDPDQSDSDNDGKGDACDRCPETSNPGDAPCPMGVDALQDETHPEHPAEGERVELSGLVVTGRRGGSNGGFFVQDPNLDEYAGIYIYDRSSADVDIGDVVSISGTYLEYNGLAELENPDVTVTGSMELAPKVVSACDVATGGAKAEAHESMLVQVDSVSVSDENPDAPDDYGTFEVEGCLWVDDTLSTDHEVHPEVGTSYTSIVGPMTYGYSQYRILPRSLDDVR